METTWAAMSAETARALLRLCFAAARRCFELRERGAAPADAAPPRSAGAPAMSSSETGERVGVATHGAEEAPLEGVARSREGDRAVECGGGGEGKPSAPDSGVRERGDGGRAARNGRLRGGREDEDRGGGDGVGLGIK